MSQFGRSILKQWNEDSGLSIFPKVTNGYKMWSVKVSQAGLEKYFWARGHSVTPTCAPALFPSHLWSVETLVFRSIEWEVPVRPRSRRSELVQKRPLTSHVWFPRCHWRYLDIPWHLDFTPAWKILFHAPGGEKRPLSQYLKGIGVIFHDFWKDKHCRDCCSSASLRILVEMFHQSWLQNISGLRAQIPDGSDWHPRRTSVPSL